MTSYCRLTSFGADFVLVYCIGIYLPVFEEVDEEVKHTYVKLEHA